MFLKRTEIRDSNTVKESTPLLTVAHILYSVTLRKWGLSVFEHPVNRLVLGAFLGRAEEAVIHVQAF
jgi:hypothetical protein